jgi:hypothetical protein
MVPGRTRFCLRASSIPAFAGTGSYGTQARSAGGVACAAGIIARWRDGVFGVGPIRPYTTGATGSWSGWLGRVTRRLWIVRQAGRATHTEYLHASAFFVILICGKILPCCLAGRGSVDARGPSGGRPLRCLRDLRLQLSCRLSGGRWPRGMGAGRSDALHLERLGQGPGVGCCGEWRMTLPPGSSPRAWLFRPTGFQRGGPGRWRREDGRVEKVRP